MRPPLLEPSAKRKGVFALPLGIFPNYVVYLRGVKDSTQLLAHAKDSTWEIDASGRRTARLSLRRAGAGGFGGLNLGGGAEDFFQGCQAGFDFVHAVGAEGFVALGSGQLADFGDGGALGDALFHGVVGD